MSEILAPQIPQPQTDDQLQAYRAVDTAALSSGALNPDVYESHHIPPQESSFFDRFTRELANDIATHKTLAYELRGMSTEDLIDTLSKYGVISQALQTSGLLESRFAPDEEFYTKDGSIVTSDESTQEGVLRDKISGLKHILLGDTLGGLHDIDTLEDLGIMGEGTDTKEVGKRTKKAHETYAAALRFGIPVDIDLDGEIDRVDLVHTRKTQFPERWSTDDVLMAIMTVAENGVPTKSFEDGSVGMLGVVGGVQIDVRVNKEGQILSGFATGKN